MTETKACVHHYMLPAPNGTSEVLGVCKKCGDEKTHDVIIPWMTWNPWRGKGKPPNDGQKVPPSHALSAGAAIEQRRKNKRESTANAKAARQKGTNDRSK
jgi:hypothetical protein